MNPDDCSYMRVIPVLNGNIYSEIYQCELTGKKIECGQCNLTEEQKSKLFLEREERLNTYL